MTLVLENVTKNFGGLRAVGDVSLSVNDGTIFGLIGPNGAGKTTVFNLITGVYKPDEGSIRFGAKDLVPLKPAQIAGAGIGRTFQNIRLFAQLTVIENLLVACELQKKSHLAAAILRLPVHYEDERTMHERALELLRVFDLHAMAEAAPTSLSYGNQRRLEIARAMMLSPALLLLDEPAAGMNYGEAEGLKTQIRWLRDTFGVAIVLVEHNMQVVMGVCEEIHVLDHGETIANGTPQQIRAHPTVLAAYLGEEEEGAESVRAARESARESAHVDVPRIAEPSVVDPSELSEGAKFWQIPEPEPSSGPAVKLSDEAALALSQDLMRNMQKGLSSRELVSAAPAPSLYGKEASEMEATRQYAAADALRLTGDATPKGEAASEASELEQTAAGRTSLDASELEQTAAGRSSFDASELEQTRKNFVADAKHWATEAARLPLPPSSERLESLREPAPREPGGLSNVDSGWSEKTLPKAAPVLEPSVPDVSKLDRGWESDKIPLKKGES